MKNSKLVLFGVMICLVIAGCASINNIFKEMTRQEILVKAATARYLHEHPAYAPKVKRVADQAILAMDASRLTTLDGVSQYFVEKLDLSQLLPEERVFVEDLIKKVQTEVIKGTSADGVADPGLEVVKAKEWLVWLSQVAERESI